MHKINVLEKFGMITDYFSPKIIGELNGQHVKLKGTVRSLDPEVRKLAEERVISIAEGTAAAFGVISRVATSRDSARKRVASSSSTAEIRWPVESMPLPYSSTATPTMAESRLATAS